MNALISLMIAFSMLMQPSDAVEPGWYVVGAGIEPGTYLVYISSKRNIDNGDTVDIGLRQPPEPETDAGLVCEVIAYSDYWNESRGWSVRNGWGLFTVRSTDYAIYTSCPMLKVNSNYNPANPFIPSRLIA
jgi:hypothetical protein